MAIDDDTAPWSLLQVTTRQSNSAAAVAHRHREDRARRAAMLDSYANRILGDGCYAQFKWGVLGYSYMGAQFVSPAEEGPYAQVLVIDEEEDEG